MNNEINNFIYGLSYDPKKLLAIPGEPLMDSEPLFSEEIKNSQYILSKSIPKNISSELYDISLLNGIEGVIYPGSLVRVNQDLAFGRPSPVSFDRLPISLNINLPGLDKENKIEIENPIYSEITSQINKSIDLWLSKNDYKIPSKQQFNISDFYSDKQCALDLGFDLNWAPVDLKNKLKVESHSTKSCIVAMYKQIFYTITYDVPASPSCLFKENVTVDNLKNTINNENPLGYIRSVDYGRLFFVKIESSDIDNHHNIDEVLKLTFSSKNTDQTLTEDQREIIKNSTISVISIGGNASEGSKVSVCSDINELKEVIKENAEFTKENIGLPISYTVSFAKDNSVATVTSTTNYVEKQYEIYDKTSISFEHKGAYVAEFIIDCKKRTINSEGKIILEPFHKTTGKITSPFKDVYDLDGCYTDFIVKAGENSALIWDKWEGRKSWRGIFKKNLQPSSKKEIKIWGTTLSPKFNIDEK